MSTNKTGQSPSVTQTIKETADCIYERLRTQVTRIGSAGGGNSHIFFIFGASVCFDLFKSNSLLLFLFT
jgi:hypothetical protein